MSSALEINLAATYSHTGSTCTTIGNAAFDVRVRDGIGSDHSFIATKKTVENHVLLKLHIGKTKTYIRFENRFTTEVEKSDQAERPISISPLNMLPHLHA